MKKRIACSFVLTLFAMLLTGCLGRSVTGNTDIMMGDLRITIGQISHEGLVEEYLWDGTEEGLVINIPDATDNGEKITEVGGYANIGVPDFFRLSLRPFDYGFEPWTGPYGKPIPEGTKEYEEAENARREYMEKNPLYGRIIEYEGDDKTLYDAPISFDELVFTIRLGKNVSSIQMEGGIEGSEYLGIRQEDNSIVFYKPMVLFECDEQNESFYTVDGVLFSSQTNEMMDIPYDYPGN